MNTFPIDILFIIYRFAAYKDIDTARDLRLVSKKSRECVENVIRRIIRVEGTLSDCNKSLQILIDNRWKCHSVEIKGYFRYNALSMYEFIKLISLLDAKIICSATMLQQRSNILLFQGFHDRIDVVSDMDIGFHSSARDSDIKQIEKDLALFPNIQRLDLTITISRSCTVLLPTANLKTLRLTISCDRHPTLIDFSNITFQKLVVYDCGIQYTVFANLKKIKKAVLVIENNHILDTTWFSHRANTLDTLSEKADTFYLLKDKDTLILDRSFPFKIKDVYRPVRRVLCEDMLLGSGCRAMRGSTENKRLLLE
jgi:hypothetical protein